MNNNLKNKLIEILGGNSFDIEKRLTEIESMKAVPAAALLLAMKFKHSNIFFFWLNLEFFPFDYYSVGMLISILKIPQSHQKRWTDIEREHLAPALKEIFNATGETILFEKFWTEATGTAQKVDGVELSFEGNKRLFDGYKAPIGSTNTETMLDSNKIKPETNSIILDEQGALPHDLTDNAAVVPAEKEGTKGNTSLKNLWGFWKR